jgi:hypothetical protein
VLALGYIGMTLGRIAGFGHRAGVPHPRSPCEFSTALLRGLIRDEAVRTDSPLGLDLAAGAQ